MQIFLFFFPFVFTELCLDMQCLKAVPVNAPVPWFPDCCVPPQMHFWQCQNRSANDYTGSSYCKAGRKQLKNVSCLVNPVFLLLGEMWRGRESTAPSQAGSFESGRVFSCGFLSPLSEALHQVGMLHLVLPCRGVVCCVFSWKQTVNCRWAGPIRSSCVLVQPSAC